MNYRHPKEPLVGEAIIVYFVSQTFEQGEHQ
jgi:hypothetical protein